MQQAVIADWDRFSAYLAAQPFCQWAAEKQRELAMRREVGPAPLPRPSSPKKNDNAELAAALASMA